MWGKHYNRNQRKRFSYLKKKPEFIRWRRAEFERLVGKCPRCGCEMFLPQPWQGGTQGLRVATVDHIVPIEEGGRNEFSNYALMCWKCNQNKDLIRKYGARAVLITEENGKPRRGRRHNADSRLYWEHRLDRANLFLRRRICAFPYIKNVFIHLANNEEVDKPLDL